MTGRFSVHMCATAVSALALGTLLGGPTAQAQQQAPAVLTPAAPAPAAEEAKPTAMATPSMTGPLVANPKPIAMDADTLGTIYMTGAISGLALFQTDPVFGDHDQRYDISNGHVILQKPDGFLQWYAQVGLYSFPTLGAPYVSAARTTGDTFTALPVVYGKIAPNDSFSFQAGKLPTLIGAEYAFTFQNMNIERGLLWAQEPIISRGIQGNYTNGPWTASLSLTDGFYSDSYNWLTGLVTYAPDKMNSFTVVAGGNLDHTSKNAFSTAIPSVVKTPIFQNNGEIVNLIYTYNNAPWTITPYFQYTHARSQPGLGVTSDASTYGGAILASYAVNDNWSFAGRAEVIGSTGSAATAPNLLGYGPGSGAWSLTLTPTYQEGIYYVRGDVSFVEAFSVPAGFGAFGKTGGSKNQARIVLEAGIVF